MFLNRDVRTILFGWKISKFLIFSRSQRLHDFLWEGVCNLLGENFAGLSVFLCSGFGVTKYLSLSILSISVEINLHRAGFSSEAGGRRYLPSTTEFFNGYFSVFTWV